MREDICAIPVNDVFSPKEGCPICRMRDMLEERIAVYITGAAMMEPDVRMETNRLGFCHTHFEQVLNKGSRLSIALILESLTQEVAQEIFPPEKRSAKKVAEQVRGRMGHCFICENVEKNMVHLIGSTIQLWQKEAEFRALYAAQPYLCLPHYGLLIQEAQKMPRKNFQPFADATNTLSKGYLSALSEDVTHFCRMYDYRNKGGDWGTSRDAIERSIAYLTGRASLAVPKADEKNR